MSKGKPFKETKLGSWLKDKAPKVLDVIGDVLPDKGLLGVVKNLIDKEDIPPEQKLEFEKMLQDYERELYSLEVEDRSSARIRETEITKSLGHIDYITYFLCIAGILVFFFIVWHLVKEEMPDQNRELLYHTIGIIEGIIISIYSYYFGSSAGSRVKDMRGK
jgi:hypothetical protein